VYISVVSVFVNDIERALAFYVTKLGWEKRDDEPMDENMRWLTVAPAGEKTQFVLMKDQGNGQPVKVGGFSGIIIETDDVRKAHADLGQRGVEFSEAPVHQPWGWWAQFKDSEGNEFGLHSP